MSTETCQDIQHTHKELAGMALTSYVWRSGPSRRPYKHLKWCLNVYHQATASLLLIPPFFTCPNLELNRVLCYTRGVNPACLFRQELLCWWMAFFLNQASWVEFLSMCMITFNYVLEIFHFVLNSLCYSHFWFGNFLFMKSAKFESFSFPFLHSILQFLLPKSSI